VPDLRGEFIRGYDDARGVDSGRVFGSAQADELKAHVHPSTTPASVTDTTSGGDTKNVGTLGDSGSAGGTETRPRNIALLAIIKY
jgi:phage-related tail fiber protein